MPQRSSSVARSGGGPGGGAAFVDCSSAASSGSNDRTKMGRPSKPRGRSAGGGGSDAGGGGSSREIAPSFRRSFCSVDRDDRRPLPRRRASLAWRRASSVSGGAADMALAEALPRVAAVSGLPLVCAVLCLLWPGGLFAHKAVQPLGAKGGATVHGVTLGREKSRDPLRAVCSTVRRLRGRAREAAARKLPRGAQVRGTRGRVVRSWAQPGQRRQSSPRCGAPVEVSQGCGWPG